MLLGVLYRAKGLLQLTMYDLTLRALETIDLSSVSESLAAGAADTATQVVMDTVRVHVSHGPSLAWVDEADRLCVARKERGKLGKLPKSGQGVPYLIGSQRAIRPARSDGAVSSFMLQAVVGSAQDCRPCPGDSSQPRVGTGYSSA